jgi:hypothetical protein
VLRRTSCVVPGTTQQFFRPGVPYRTTFGTPGHTCFALPGQPPCAPCFARTDSNSISAWTLFSAMVRNDDLHCVHERVVAEPTQDQRILPEVGTPFPTGKCSYTADSMRPRSPLASGAVEPGFSTVAAVNEVLLPSTPRRRLKATSAASAAALAAEKVATASGFTQDDACIVARAYRLDFRRISRGLLFEPGANSGAISRYEQARRQLKHCGSLERFGFRVFDDFVTMEEANAVLAFCDATQHWERRGENTAKPMAGTQRLNLGVALNKDYRPVRITQLPPVLSDLGARALRHCQQQEWPYSCTNIQQTPAFQQVRLRSLAAIMGF